MGRSADSSDDMLLVRPIGGLDDEVVGICKAIEPVTSASFSLPNGKAPATSIRAGCSVTPHGFRLGQQRDHFGASERLRSTRGHISSSRY